MNTIEDRLRAELKRLTDQAQPGQLRPLRVPQRRSSGRRRLLPAGAVVAVTAMITVTLVLVNIARVNRPATVPPLTADMPRYYVTVSQYSTDALRVAGHDSATGRVTGTATMTTAVAPLSAETVSAAPDGRTFYFSAPENAPRNSASSYDYRLFRVRLTADGRPGAPAELSEIAGLGALAPVGMALSPDGKSLAISLAFFPGLSEPTVNGGLQVIDLASGVSRIWTIRNDSKHWPGTPVWVHGDKMVAFPWWHLSGFGREVQGVRLLNITAPGTDLLSSHALPAGSVSDLTTSALITSDGREIIEATCREVPAGGVQVTRTLQITEAPVGNGRSSRVVMARNARYRNRSLAPSPYESCAVLSADGSGRHILVRAFGFGRIDNGVFTSLPDVPMYETFQAAAW